MRKFLSGFVFAGFILLSSVFNGGCVYTNIKVPLDTDVNQTRLGEKVGTASFESVLWLFAWGDASTNAAATDGNIKTINHLDGERFMIFFGLYSRVTTIAYGD